MALTGRLALLALLGAVLVAVVGSGWAVLAVDAVLAIGVAVDLALAGSVRGLRLSRSGETVVRLGEAAEVTLRISNPGRRRVRAVVRDAWPPSAGAARTRSPIDLPPGERRSLTTTLVPTRRGDRVADRVTIRSYGPFGLAARQGSHSAPWRVRALPPFTSRKHLPSKLARLRDLDGRTAVLVRGQGTEFDSLREYVPGDDVRSIDWRATARAGDVVVRTWRPERDRRVLLVLDTGRTAAGRVGDAPRLDAAMDAALLLAALAARAGDRVDFIAHDRVLRRAVQGSSATELLPSLVQAMAPLDAQLVEPDWEAIAAEVLRRAPHRSLVVLLTALDPAPVEHGLLPVLPRLTRKHRVLLASVADPRIAEMAAGRADAEAVYDAAAGSRAGLDRVRVAAALNRTGVTVVEGSPEDLPPRLADGYLALKAAGLL
jgi:uncharacterized protein (DUF58 family)